MTVSSADFLVSAAVCNAAGSEVDLRNCISRAYYSIYHAALPVADAYFPDQHPNHHMGAHTRLSKRFTDSKSLSAKGVGYVLEVVKRARHRADYDLTDTIDASDAAQALATARAFPGRLAQCVPTQGTSSAAQTASKP